MSTSDDKYLSQIAGRLAHKLRNPLNVIQVNVQLLEADLKEASLERKPSTLNLLEDIQAAVAQLDKILSEFLIFAQLPEANWQDIRVNELLQLVSCFFTGELARKKIEISLELEPKEPLIRGDEQQLRQAFFNIISNAIEAMPQGGELKIITRLVNHSVEIQFMDTGSGIQEPQLSKIFEPFFTTKENATGLGLSYVQRVITRHNGQIEVQSQAGEGTTFILRLPARD